MNIPVEPSAASGTHHRRWPMVALLAVVGIMVFIAAAGVVWRVHQETVIATRAADARKAAGAPGSAPPPGSYQIEAALFTRGAGVEGKRLAPDAMAASGDRLFLEIRASVPTHVYVFREDDHGASYVLFPLPGQVMANPLTPGATHRLPGPVGTGDEAWQVTNAGGREHILIFASPDRLDALDRVLAALPRSQTGRLASAAPVSPATAQLLSRLGGNTSAPQESGSQGPPRLSAQFQSPLSPTAETATGVWVRHLTIRRLP